MNTHQDEIPPKQNKRDVIEILSRFLDEDLKKKQKQIRDAEELARRLEEAKKFRKPKASQDEFKIRAIKELAKTNPAHASALSGDNPPGINKAPTYPYFKVAIFGTIIPVFAVVFLMNAFINFTRHAGDPNLSAEGGAILKFLFAALLFWISLGAINYARDLHKRDRRPPLNPYELELQSVKRRCEVLDTVIFVMKYQFPKNSNTPPPHAAISSTFDNAINSFVIEKLRGYRDYCLQRKQEPLDKEFAALIDTDEIDALLVPSLASIVSGSTVPVFRFNVFIELAEKEKWEQKPDPIPEPPKLGCIGTDGKNNIYWPSYARTKHLYIPGISGYGKTTLMASLAIQDICETDHPIIVIDPKGSREGLVERILPFVPERRARDVYYISLRNPVPLDLLSYRDPSEKSLVTADIIAILKRFSYGSWGPTMQGTLRKLIPTLLEAPDATFLDIGAFLESKDRREQILRQVSPERAAYWRENPPSKADAGPLTSRIANFEEPPLRTIVGARRGEGLNIEELIEQNKIILVDTSPLTEDGLILGALIMSRIQQAIFRRSSDREHRCCQVYADEFHNFVTSAFNVMLSQARSFNLSLCIANQHPKQITEIWDDITGCVSSYVLFRMDGAHALMLKSKIQDPTPPPPPPKLDMSAIKARLAFLKEREAYIGTLTNESSLGWTPRDINEAEGEIWRERVKIEDLMEKHANQPAPPKPLSYLDQIPSLQVGEAIYISHDGTTTLIRTERMPAPPQPNYSQQIRNASSAQSGQKRTEGKASCNPQQIRQDVGNEHRITSAEKPEVQPGSAPSNIPPHENKT
jgi:hypothetical protein